MSNSVYDKLEAKISSLKEMLSKTDTESLIGLIATEFGNMINPAEDIFTKTNLSSPFKQYLYVIGLILSSEENERLIILQEDRIERIKGNLNEIVDLYSELFEPEEGEDVNEQWIKSREVSMQVFLNYFNTNSLTYEEQVIDRLNVWFSPYSNYIKGQIGITVEELINIFRFIQNNIQKRMDNIKSLQKKVGEDHDFLLGKELQLMHQVKVDDLINEFGEGVAGRFIELFSMERKKRDFFYYTETNPFEKSPIWKKTDKVLFVPLYKQVIHAIYLQLITVVESSELKSNFYRNRDHQTEKKAENLFKGFFKEKGNYYTSVFEDNQSQKEHDLVIKFENYLLIVEIKASKVKEPFRNPDKAFKRIKGDFNSDGGIQKAYNQANNLKKLINSNETTVLYNSKGEELVTIERSMLKKVYSIVVTAEDMGIIGVNLSYLLKKEDNEPYPWATNIFDLETGLEAIKYMKKNQSEFINYLDERERYHTYLITTDELEILGYYLENGSFDDLKASKPNHFIFFDPNWSMVFDDIYFEKRGLIPPSVKDRAIIKQPNPNTKKRKSGKKKFKLKQAKKSRKRNR
ncbi:hypothetical protein SAMN05421743_101215 [Thalassobacillus cyri]|uniref:Nuclease-related domain-containing protein n=1 Tax=Thalassobacillus cyri TaxID=571932 RepID=A0A1H3VWS4_9BACI|nr:hypothetical protein [Thalassobacillus cyri]SDZ79141.1 hypothetical protein SAMN05421743_101215 [Thalassobacillus cyri]